MAKGRPKKRPGAPPTPATPRAEPRAEDRCNDLLVQRKSSAFLEDNPERQQRLGLPHDDVTPTPVMVELNLLHAKALGGADKRFQKLCEQTLPGKPLRRIADTYYRLVVTLQELDALLDADEKAEDGATPVDAKRRAIYRVWPDFDLHPLIDRSITTVKADAARRSFNAAGSDIVWAVVDSGIDATHPHFQTYHTLDHPDVADLHCDFTVDPSVGPATALTDDRGHGTHVAGIIAGAAFDPMIRPAPPQPEVLVARRGSSIRPFEERTVDDLTLLAGVAPRCKLISLKVITGVRARNTDSSSNVLRALQYVRRKLNGEGKIQRVHGVNLSLGYEFDAKWFACGQSPICVEVDRLVRSGVVVVVAAGNTGYGNLTSREGFTSTGLALTINDPGNASLAITVGATHRDSPHTYGVSFFSSKGPTGDGRLKPDLVAPGERITSCAAGVARASLAGFPAFAARPVDPARPRAYYVDESGTSMAAPHVSGATAAFLSIRREFIGRPEDVKRILLQSATSLGRERYFEGHGLIDLMRAIQSV